MSSSCRPSCPHLGRRESRAKAVTPGTEFVDFNQVLYSAHWEAPRKAARKEQAMPASSAQHVTQLLQAWSQGKDAALEELLPLVHQELRRLARRYMFGERPGHTLQTTALVNEAYLRLVNSRKVNWQNRAHFFAISAQLMRRILVDYARARGYQKRGGGVAKVTLDEALMGPQEKGH